MSEKNKNPIPQCVGIIMDGNRRWAKAEGLSPQEGHTVGYEKVKDVLQWGKDAGVKDLIIYALSTENWKRSPLEINHLLNLFRRLAKKFSDEIDAGKHEGLRVRFMGDLSRFPKDLQDAMHVLAEKTKERTSYTLALALSYGGRLEIVEAAKKIAAQGADITEESFSHALWTTGFPDPDLILRTGGEQRLSGFLPWQSVYSELFFTKTFWPAFSKEEFTQILEEYAGRIRNFGT